MRDESESMTIAERPLSFRPLASGDVPAAVRLSTQAGWNQTDADWRRLLCGWPETCLGGFADGLVATGTLATFASTTVRPTGWIGMILVDERHRGRGHGAAMMRELLHTARRMRLAGVGLDATDLGRPVYAKLGFVPHAGLSRWLRRATESSIAAPVPPEARPLEAADWPAVAALDSRALGVVRRPLLEGLAAEPGGMGIAAIDRGRLAAFGLARPGRTARAIGPVVAEHAATSAAVLAGLLAAMDDADVLIDLPDGSPLEPAVRSAGFAVARRVTRMLLPIESAPATLLSPLAHAAASFELG